MPIELQIWERRDSGNREIMGNLAVQLTRIVRARDGISSCKFYWGIGTHIENLVAITEGELEALNNPAATAPSDYLKAALTLCDHARCTLSMRFQDPRAAVEGLRQLGLTS
jgi:hypothetical protein